MTQFDSAERREIAEIALVEGSEGPSLAAEGYVSAERAGQFRAWRVQESNAPARIQNAIEWADSGSEGGKVWLPDRVQGGTGPVPIDSPIDYTPENPMTFIGGRLQNQIDHGDPDGGGAEGQTPGVFDIGREEPKFETSLSGDVTQNDEDIPVSAVSGTVDGEDVSINVGDLIGVQAETNTLEGGDPGEGMGEAHKVVAVDGTTLTIEGTLAADYNAADSSAVYAWDPVEVHFNGVEISTTQARVDAEEYTRGIRLLHCINSTIEDCHIHDLVVAGVKVWGGYDLWIHNNKIDDIYRPTSSGYGVAVSREANRIVIEGNQLRRCRHNVSSYNSGGSTARGWPQLTVRGNELTGGPNAMVDAHVGVWRLVCVGNTAANQGDDDTFNQPFCNIGAVHTVICDNHVETCTVFASDRGDGDAQGTCSIKNNTCQYVTGTAITFDAGRLPQQIDVQGNTFYEVNNVCLRFGDVTGISNIWDRVYIAGNYFTGDGNTTAFEVFDNAKTVINRFTFKDNTFSDVGTGIEISWADNLLVDGNEILVSDDGIVIDNCSDGLVAGNRCEFEFANNTGIVVTNSTDIYVQNNLLKNYNTAVSGATTETDNVLL